MNVFHVETGKQIIKKSDGATEVATTGELQSTLMILRLFFLLDHHHHQPKKFKSFGAHLVLVSSFPLW